MKNYSRKINFLFLLCIAGMLQAQTPVEMIVSMNKAYAVAGYSMNVKVNYFMGNNDVTPVQSYSGEVYKNGENYYSSIMGKTTVVNKHCTVFIDNGEKLIVYSSNEHVKKNNSPVELPDTSLFGKMAKYTFGKGTEESVRIIIIPGDVSFYKQIEVVVNRKTFVLEEVVYDYKVEEDPAESIQKLVVTYSAVNLAAIIPADKFSESTFITRQKGKLTGVGKYISYQVIEQENTLPPNLH